MLRGPPSSTRGMQTARASASRARASRLRRWALLAVNSWALLVAEGHELHAQLPSKSAVEAAAVAAGGAPVEADADAPAPDSDEADADALEEAEVEASGAAPGAGGSVSSSNHRFLRGQPKGKVEVQGAQKWRPWDSSLREASDGELMTFYTYRAVSDEVYSPINVNSASLGGVLWYLHHEVVVQYPRKFKIAKIMRIKVQVRATTPLLRLNMNFGPRVAFDKGQCTGPFVCGRYKKGGPQPKFCAGAFSPEYEDDIRPLNNKPFYRSYEFSKFGFHVGCNNLGEYPFPMYPVYYPEAVWYSFPGSCLSDVYNERSADCAEQEPGGLCQNTTPTGEGDCTWNYEVMGEVTLDEVVGEAVKDLNWRGGREYDPFTDEGTLTTWWNGINDTKANLKRMAALEKAFETKYPDQPLDSEMSTPKCDFNMGSFYREFWYKDPFAGNCEDAEADSACGQQIHWVLHDGRYAHPEWFPSIDANSTFKDVQRLLHAQGKVACPHRPCDEGIPPEGLHSGEDEGSGNTTTTTSEGDAAATTTTGESAEEPSTTTEAQAEDTPTPTTGCANTPVSRRRREWVMTSCRRRHREPGMHDSDVPTDAWVCNPDTNQMVCNQPGPSHQPAFQDTEEEVPDEEPSTPTPSTPTPTPTCTGLPVSRRRRNAIMHSCRRRHQEPGLWDSDAASDTWVCNAESNTMECNQKALPPAR